MKLEINNKRKKIHKYVEIKNTFLNQCIKQEINREIKKYLDLDENENATYQNFGEAAKQF